MRVAPRTGGAQVNPATTSSGSLDGTPSGGWTMQTDLDDDFLVLLYDVARQMRTITDQMAREHDSTRAQCIILARLERQPGLSQNELAAMAEAAPITVARLVDRLEAQGLVERCADPDDRRIWRLRLTPAAAPVLRDIKRYRAEVRALMTKGVSPAVLKAMVAGLRKMKANLSSSLAEAAE
jgi:MarR family transcriptional regulator for hemolysin